MIFLVILTLLNPISSQETHAIEKFVHNPGIYYEQIGRLYLTTSIWSLAATTDASSWLTRADQLQKHFSKAAELCDISGENGFRLILQQWMGDLSERRDVITGLLGLKDSLKKSRRNRDGRGSLGKLLFDTMDSRDAERIHEQLMHLESPAGNSGRQLEVVNSSMLESVQLSKVFEGNEVLKQAILKSDDGSESLKKRMYLLEHFLMLKIVYADVIGDSSKIRRLLIDEDPSILETRVLKEETLADILQSAKLPNGLSFPVDLKIGKMHELEKISSVTVRVFGTKIVTFLDIPLVDLQPFDVLLTHGIPVRTTNDYHSYLEPTNQLLVVNLAAKQYVPMTEKELSNCERIQERYLCTDSFPVQMMRSWSPCDVQMLSNPVKFPDSCRPKHTILNRLLLIRMRKNNAWIFISPKAEPITIKCGDKNNHVILKDSGILQVSDFCEIHHPDFLIRGRKSYGMKLNERVHPRLNLTLDDVITEQLERGENHFGSALTGVVGSVRELKGFDV